jgi:hypothetical protein
MRTVNASEIQAGNPTTMDPRSPNGPFCRESLPYPT